VNFSKRKERAVLLFYLEDRVTGETRNMAAPDGTTETEVREAYGGLWLDQARVTCAPPCRVGRRMPAVPVNLDRRELCLVRAA
jgi:hypothetical protein